MRQINRFYGLVGLLLVTLLLGCGEGVREHTPRLLDEWGRARLIGYAEQGGEIGMGVRPDGTGIMVAFFSKTPDGVDVVHLQVMDELGAVLHEVEQPIGGERPEGLQVNSDEDGVTVAWRVRNEGVYSLWVHTFSWDGTRVGDAQEIQAEVGSRADDRGMRWHKVVRTEPNKHLILWLDGRNILQATVIQGASLTTTTLQDEVVNADMMLDAAGVGQLVWSRDVDGVQFFYHSTLDVDRVILAPPTQGIPLYAGNNSADPKTVNGPTIALEDDTIYVIWSRDQNTPVGSFLRLFYSHFPYGGDAQTATPPNMIDIPGYFPPNVTPAQGDLPYESIARPNDIGIAGLAYPNSAVTAFDSQGAETAFTVSVFLQTRNRKDNQPAIIYLRDGEVLGYQVLTWTDLNSGKSSIGSDEDKNLYVSWVDARRNAKNPVYLMSTQAEFVAENGGLGSADYQTIALELLNRMVRGVALVFVMAPWVVNIFFCFLGGILFARGDVYERRAHLIFRAATGFYLLGKYISGMELLRMLPNAAFISPPLYTVLVYTTPLIILSISIAIVWLCYSRRTKDPSALRWFLLVVMLDYILSIIFYSLGYFE